MECNYPNSKGIGGYKKGCRCERCVQNNRNNTAKWRNKNKAEHASRVRAVYATPEGRAKEVLRANNRAARAKGYAEMDATWQDVMAIQQETECCHCGTTDNLCVDHCHETGRLRGRLCDTCNKKDVLNGQ